MSPSSVDWKENKLYGGEKIEFQSNMKTGVGLLLQIPKSPPLSLPP